MKIFKKAVWVRKKIAAAITELTSAIEESKIAIGQLKARLQITSLPFQNLENSPEMQQMEIHNQKIYVFQVTIGSLHKLLDLISEYKEDDTIEIDTGDDKAWLMSTVNEDAE